MNNDKVLNSLQKFDEPILSEDKTNNLEDEFVKKPKEFV